MLLECLICECLIIRATIALYFVAYAIKHKCLFYSIIQVYEVIFMEYSVGFDFNLGQMFQTHIPHTHKYAPFLSGYFIVPKNNCMMENIVHFCTWQHKTSNANSSLRTNYNRNKSHGFFQTNRGGGEKKKSLPNLRNHFETVRDIAKNVIITASSLYSFVRSDEQHTTKET